MTAERHLWDPDDETRDDETSRASREASDLSADDVRSLERALSPRRWVHRELSLDEPPARDVDDLLRETQDDESDPWDVPAWQRRPRVDEARTPRLVALSIAAFAVVLFLGDMLGWYSPSKVSAPISDDPAFAGEGFELEVVTGMARIESETGREEYTLGRGLLPGERLVCDDATRALLGVGGHGSVDVRPGSRLVLQSAGDDDGTWSLFLERGEVRASIFAVPRLFQVGTPAGIAVDLGCEYTARVDDDGAVRLAVESGRVSFETGARTVLVPAGAETRARPGEGPGTPVWAEANSGLRDAVAVLDAVRSGAPDDDGMRPLDEREAKALAAVLEVPGARHGLTLWHLLTHPLHAVRAAVYDDLAGRVPPPASVTREAIVEGRDARACDAWHGELAYGW